MRGGIRMSKQPEDDDAEARNASSTSSNAGLTHRHPHFDSVDTGSDHCLSLAFTTTLSTSCIEISCHHASRSRRGHHPPSPYTHYTL